MKLQRYNPVRKVKPFLQQPQNVQPQVVWLPPDKPQNSQDTYSDKDYHLECVKSLIATCVDIFVQYSTSKQCEHDPKLNVSFLRDDIVNSLDIIRNMNPDKYY